MSPRFSYIIFYFLIHLLRASAQNAVPSNDTLTGALASGELQLALQDHGVHMTYSIDFALDVSQSRSRDQQQLQGIEITGNLVLTTPFSLTNLTTGDLAYISCDATNYTGNVNLEQTINVATSKILPSPTTQDSNSGAIILYSTTSTWCNFTNSSTTNNLYSYPYVFVLPNAKIAKRLETYLQSASDPQSTQASISMNMSSMGNGSASSSFESDDSDLGPTPTTTVAMIILYSVTGIITLCFIVVIITGAIRAHRHPDRYGLLNLPGGAHQRRARGIARAMLDTIPIVKFGEKEPMKVPQDVEHGVELSEGPDSVAQARGAIGAMESANGQENSEAQRSEEEQSSQAAEAPVSPQNAAEEGLACSVCTEDFVKGQDTRVLPCNHKFHPECIDPWLLNVSGTCPLCRVDLRDPQSGTADPSENTDEHFYEQEGSQRSSSFLESQTAVPTHRPLRFSIFLNRHRMRDATPEQRVTALRELREARRASNAEGAADAPGSRRSRVSRFFRRDTSSQVPPVPSPARSSSRESPQASSGAEIPHQAANESTPGSQRGADARSSENSPETGLSSSQSP